MNVIIVHGTFGDPFENWFPWLASELNLKGIHCTVPTFPTPECQNYQDWEELMNYYLRHKFVDENTVLVGHSCGAIFLVHYLLKRKIKIKGLICVSGYNGFISGNEVMDNLNQSFYINNQNIRMDGLANHVHSFFSDNDPNIPQDYLIRFANDIRAESHCISGAGHFNEIAGYKTFDEILDVIVAMNK